VLVYDLDPETVASMVRVDLATVEVEPDSAVANFSFNGCTRGVTAFRGRPPWEFHAHGDELLFILSGHSDLTILEDGEHSVRRLSAGQLAIVPKGRWHSNDAPSGATILWVTPSEGNDHSWDEPTVRGEPES
jgi:mannose-6-phosphate isomerase-like protein (cupin superfamily)